MTWEEFVYEHVKEFCNRNGSRTFSLKEFYKDKEEIFKRFRPNNRFVLEKIRQQLQFLRDKGLITFMDNSGHYTWRGEELLEGEKEEISTIDLSREVPEKREYIVETYVRKIKWAQKAVEVLGDDCLYKECKNTFIRDDGTKYIEVHHIIPLCEGGENAIWNLSVLCAHHHKMAHFADKKTRDDIKNYLQNIVRDRINI